MEKGYKCWYYTQFKGNYLFHSIIYNLDGSIRDGRLGMKLSDGCIRLAKLMQNGYMIMFQLVAQYILNKGNVKMSLKMAHLYFNSVK